MSIRNMIATVVAGDAQADRVVPPTGYTAWLTLFSAGAMAFLAVFAMALSLATDRLASFETDELPFGDQILTLRAGANRNLPFVLFGRARLHHALVARRSHARREALVIAEADGAAVQLPELDNRRKRSLVQAFERLAKNAPEIETSAVEALAATLDQVLEGDAQDS